MQIVVHGLPYATTWQGLKDLTRTVTAAGGREVSPVSTGRLGWLVAHVLACPVQIDPCLPSR